MFGTARIRGTGILLDNIARAYTTHVIAQAFGALGIKGFQVEERAGPAGLGYTITWSIEEQATGEPKRLQQYREESRKRYAEIKKAREERDRKLFQQKEYVRKVKKLKELQQRFKEAQQKYRDAKQTILEQARKSLQNRLNRMTETGKLMNEYTVTDVKYDQDAKVLRFKVDLS